MISPISSLRRFMATGLSSLLLLAAASGANAGLIAHYDFDDASISGGSLQNLQNPGNSDGVITGSVTTGVSGLFGQAFQFGGAGSLNLGTGVVKSQIEGTETFSISAWVNLSSTAAGDILYRRDIPGTTDAEGGLRIAAGGAPEMFMQDGGAGSDGHTSPTSLDLGSWSHVVGIRNPFPGGLWRIYVDGVESSGGGSVFSIAGEAGVPQIGTGLFGLLDEIRVYDHALTTGEVEALYAEGAAAQVPAPAAGFFLLSGLAGLAAVRRRKG